MTQPREKIVVTNGDGSTTELLSFSIVISAATRRGRRKLHTFDCYSDSKLGGKASYSNWHLTTPPPARQRRSGDVDTGGLWTDPAHARRQTGIEVVLHEETGTVHLAPGVDLQGMALSVILDALRSDHRHEVDIEDVKVVLSQLGSHINGAAAQRRHALQALCAEILRRCTTI